MEIIKYQVYIWVDGNNFDPDRFNKSLDADNQGLVLYRKRVENGEVEKYGQYWKSNDVDVHVDRPEESLENLLRLLRIDLLKIKDIPSIRIVAEFVVIYNTNDSTRGFFFSPTTIQLLDEIGAGLDLDIYNDN